MHKLWLVITGLTVATGLLRTDREQAMALPIDIQLAMFDKILTYDRAFRTHVGDEVVVGILFQERYRASLLAKTSVLDAVERDGRTTIGRVPVRFIVIELTEGDALEQAVSEHAVDVMYVTPLRAYDLAAISRFGNTHNIITLTGVPEYVTAGIAIGVGLRGDKPEILVNLDVCEAAGIELSSQLLRLARVL